MAQKRLRLSSLLCLLRSRETISLLIVVIFFMIYRHECFIGKYTTREVYTKSHPGPGWRIILTSEDILTRNSIFKMSQIYIKLRLANIFFKVIKV